MNRFQAQPGAFEALMDAAVDAIVIIDSDGRIEHFNRSAQRMFGYAESEVLGQNVSLLMPEPHRDRHDSYLARYLATGEAAIIGKGREESGLRRNGERFPMRLSVGQFQLEDAAHFVGIIHDLSQRRATEEKLHLLEQQLFHADRLVTLGELTAGIAHEINQPLTAISAYADAGHSLVEQGGSPSSPDIGMICQRIAEQSRRAAAVVDRLRRLVRSGSASKGLHDIRNIIENTLLLFDHELKKFGIKLAVSLPDNLRPVYVDEVQIQQILVNLVKNSMDAIHEAGRADGLIRIIVEQGASELTLSVQDNGPGVAAESLPHLFEPFYTSKPRGVGLGLSICKTIAMVHGGRLFHRPVPSGGACFVLALPLASIG